MQITLSSFGSTSFIRFGFRLGAGSEAVDGPAWVRSGLMLLERQTLPLWQ
jgi:hypothetical protein